MYYLITNSYDIETPYLCIRDDFAFDSVIFWEKREDARKILYIESDSTVVIAIKTQSTVALITSELQKRLSHDQIVDFYKIYRANIPLMVAKRAMVNPLRNHYNGLIMGLSHAEVGIIAENLRYPTANLAVSSQDLFYNYVTLKYVLENFPDKLKNLKFLIIDMYKYNYFNFDTSMSKMALTHCLLGGYNLHPHNFAHNRNYSFSYDEMVKYTLNVHNYGDISEKTISKWSSIFNFNTESLDEEIMSNWPSLYERDKIISGDDIDNYNYSPSNVLKHFDDTISENIEYFEKIISSAKNYNSSMDIYVILMPMYEKAWMRSSEYYLPWKSEFEDIIYKIQNTYDIKYYNWTVHPISKEANYWYDAEHLNYLGALKFTQYLNDIINP